MNEALKAPEVHSRWLWTSWVVATAIMHVTWGVVLISALSAAMATPVASMARLFPGHVAEGVALVLASLAACYGVRVDRDGPSMRGLALCLPQQALLIVSGIGSLTAASTGVYADGTPSTREHIFVDQLPMLLMVAGHTFGLLLFHGQSVVRGR